MKERNIFIACVIILLLIYNVLISINIKTDINYYENNIQDIQTKIDSVNQLNKALDKKLNSLNIQLQSIDSTIVNVNYSIENIKQKTDEQINSVDNFTFNELEQFFSNRYKTRLNSSSESTNR